MRSSGRVREIAERPLFVNIFRQRLGIELSQFCGFRLCPYVRVALEIFRFEPHEPIKITLAVIEVMLHFSGLLCIALFLH